jgi:hypothetical protein
MDLIPMLNRLLRTVTIVLFTLLINSSVRADGRDGSLTAADRSDVVRLERNVTINSNRILLGRLL